ncbi:MAG: carbamoyltransferase HypF [Candidatus Altiarchaeales archaeon]|nr:MAG: carbamoyltransferase HypF [Candidatus Altiarchaeales archaeon]
MSPISAIISVSGIVQGVGFRPSIYRIARKFALNGYVRNLGFGGVEIRVEGERERIEKFIKLLEREKPKNSRIDKIDVKFGKALGQYRGFKIIHSGGRGSIGFIPADISICDNCVDEIFSENNRRYLYEFTTCTDCGPRFTTIERIPYDRKNTSFHEFDMCDKCKKEYKNPDDRRFHAQTIACRECGPGYFLLDKKFERIENPIESAVKFLKNGKILCIKGIGGMHIASITTNDEIISELRKKLKRPQQPFAVMCPDIGVVKRFAIIGKREENALKSRERPIVILRKSEDYHLSDNISPGLDTIGVMLPCTGIQHIILRKIKEPLIMTSANIPGEPMIIRNKDAKEFKIADYLLLHDLRIVNRCDDSVIKFINNKRTFIRRSRGFAPVPIELDINFEKNILAVGAEENVTACLLTNKRAFLTQHIGDTRSLNTLNYLEDAIIHLMKLTKSKPDAIACDLHPNFNTTRFAIRFCRENEIPLIRVQHHYAHLASLIAEYGCDKIVGICVDGYGYGEDGRAWGGEIILYKNGEFSRVGHLEEQRMPGGDIAAYYPGRMVAGILYNIYPKNELKKILIRNGLRFRHGTKEIDILINQIDKDINVMRTTSMGRVLDAVSSLLGVCHYRSYGGEPAMKLDSLANKGKRLLEFPIHIRDGILNTTEILNRVLELKEDGYKKEDIAFSAEVALAMGIAEIAVMRAKIHNIDKIGISGGVSYNNVIVTTISKYLEDRGIEFLQHRKVPPGDGGLSLGQVRYAIDNFFTVL